jgi:hypothetical protein
VPQPFLEVATEGFRDDVRNSYAELVFNVDEIGVNEWEDCIERQIIVSSTMRGQMIYHGLHCNLKHISVVVCISTSEEHMTLFFVCSQVNDLLGRRLKTKGFRMGLDSILERRNKPYMNSQRCTEDISTFLLLYIDELRLNEEFADKGAVPLMDTCFIHIQSEISTSNLDNG